MVPEENDDMLNRDESHHPITNLNINESSIQVYDHNSSLFLT